MSGSRIPELRRAVCLAPEDMGPFGGLLLWIAARPGSRRQLAGVAHDGDVGDVFTSTFDSVDWRYRLMPAVEWSLYPYREATRRRLTIAYRIGGSHIAYRDTTIYDEIEQFLPEHTLTAGYEVTQPWGQVDVGVNASQYLHDLERYSLRFNGRIDVRITQALSIELGGNVAFIQNQLNLPKGDADLEEVLFRRRQLETD